MSRPYSFWDRDPETIAECRIALAQLEAAEEGDSLVAAGLRLHIALDEATRPLTRLAERLLRRFLPAPAIERTPA